jgi:hypothetical protein
MKQLVSSKKLVEPTFSILFFNASFYQKVVIVAEVLVSIFVIGCLLLNFITASSLVMEYFEIISRDGIGESVEIPSHGLVKNYLDPSDSIVLWWKIHGTYVHWSKVFVATKKGLSYSSSLVWLICFSDPEHRAMWRPWAPFASIIEGTLLQTRLSGVDDYFMEALDFFLERGRSVGMVEVQALAAAFAALVRELGESLVRLARRKRPRRGPAAALVLLIAESLGPTLTYLPVYVAPLWLVRDVAVLWVLPPLRVVPAIHDTLFRLIFTVGSSRVLVALSLLSYLTSILAFKAIFLSKISATKEKLLFEYRIS